MSDIMCSLKVSKHQQEHHAHGVKQNAGAVSHLLHLPGARLCRYLCPKSACSKQLPTTLEYGDA